MSKFKLRKKPRRIIYAFPFNHEFDILEARIHDLAEVVDVFIIQESNHTNSGKSKRLSLKDRLEKNWLWKYHSKILYLAKTSTPVGGFRCVQLYNNSYQVLSRFISYFLSDGVAVDKDMRRHLGQEGLRRITDVRLDDLYVFTDGDEIPKSEVLLFLKIYDGIPQLVALHNIWAIFGFFWQVDPLIYGGGIHHTNTVLTVQFFRDFYQYDASRVRTNDYLKEGGPKRKKL